MFYHQQYHICIEENPYVTQGSILACTKGTNLTRLDARTAVDIRDIVTGLPVLGCDACKADENIYSFYGCRASDLSNTPARPVIAGGYKKCIPMLGMWTQPHQTSIIWNSVSGDHTETLIFDSVILCRFGGMIGVVEIPEAVQTTGEIVLITNDSVNIRDAAGGSTVVAILKNEVLITDLSDLPVQAADSEGNTLEWIRVRYFNQKDEAHPEIWEWIDGWAAKKFTYECPKNPPGKNELHCVDDYILQAQMLTNARYVRRKLLEAGWSTNAVYAILGNMETESNINPLFWERTNTGKKGKGFGLVQWTPQSKLTDWTTLEGLNPNDIDVQIQRILVEVDLTSDEQWVTGNHNSGMTFKEFTQSTESAEKLAEIFLYCYEQPTVMPQPARSKQARKWKDLLELLND